MECIRRHRLFPTNVRLAPTQDYSKWASLTFVEQKMKDIYMILENRRIVKVLDDGTIIDSLNWSGGVPFLKKFFIPVEIRDWKNEMVRLK